MLVLANKRIGCTVCSMYYVVNSEFCIEHDGVLMILADVAGEEALVLAINAGGLTPNPVLQA